MPRKSHTLTDEERRKRIEEKAKEIGASNDPEDFEWAFRTVISSDPPAKPSEHKATKPIFVRKWMRFAPVTE
jgi:hypothetical protein